MRRLSDWWYLHGTAFIGDLLTFLTLAIMMGCAVAILVIAATGGPR